MKSKDLEKNLKLLREITPDTHWKANLKFEILNKVKKEERKIVFPLPLRWQFVVQGALIGLILVISFLGLFQGGEKSIDVVSNGKINYLTFAEKSLEEIKEIAKNNGDQIIAQKTVEVKEVLKKAVQSLPKPNNIKEAKEIVEKVTKINKKAKELEENLGITIEETRTLTTKTAQILYNEIEETFKQIVEKEITDLKARSLTTDQKKLLEEAERLYFEGKYQDAWIKILELTNSQ